MRVNRWFVPEAAQRLSVADRSWWWRGPVIGAFAGPIFAAIVLSVAMALSGAPVGGVVLGLLLSWLGVFPGVVSGVIAGLLMELGRRRRGPLVIWVYGSALAGGVVSWLLLVAVTNEQQWVSAWAFLAFTGLAIGSAAAATGRIVIGRELTVTGQDDTEGDSERYQAMSWLQRGSGLGTELLRVLGLMAAVIAFVAGGVLLIASFSWHFVQVIPDSALLPLPTGLALEADGGGCGSQSCDRAFVVSGEGMSVEEVGAAVADHLQAEKGWSGLHFVGGSTESVKRGHTSVRVETFHESDDDGTLHWAPSVGARVGVVPQLTQARVLVVFTDCCENGPFG